MALRIVATRPNPKLVTLPWHLPLAEWGDDVVVQLPGVMEAAGVACRVESYSGTDHGFAFPKRPAYVKAAGERHFERMFALYDRSLRAR